MTPINPTPSGRTLAAAGYVGWEISQSSDTPVETRTTATFFTGDTEQVIQYLDGQPKWNGPGNPTFGVGDGQP